MDKIYIIHDLDTTMILEEALPGSVERYLDDLDLPDDSEETREEALVDTTFFVGVFRGRVILMARNVHDDLDPQNVVWYDQDDGWQPLPV